jgi:hypothetical protein
MHAALFLIMLCAILARINIYPWEFPYNQKRPLPFFRRTLKLLDIRWYNAERKQYRFDEG